MASAGLIVDSPSAAVLVVESTVLPLSFQSRGGIRKVTEPEPGVYRVFLSPGVHHVEIRAEGYLPLKLPRWNFPPRSGRRIRVSARRIQEGEGTLIVESRPSGAAIELGGVPLAVRTPATLTHQKSGGYRVHLSGVSGYGEVDTTAVVRTGETTRLVVLLPRLVAGLRVESDPPGALVVLDGDTLGQTPLSRPDLSPGERTVVILLEGYEPNVQPVRLRTGRTATLNAYLVPLTGCLRVTTTPGGTEVYLAGEGLAEEFLGVCPDTGLVREKLRPGRYWVRAEQEGYRPARDTVEVAGGRTVEVAQKQWEAVMGRNPSYYKGANRPVEEVSWNDVQAFIHRLNEAAGDSLYRLPTEAEWEYACRAGTSTRWSFGDDESRLGEYAYYGNSGGQTHPVGRKRPNPWGLYDMHGDVWEWCQDWYSISYL